MPVLSYQMHEQNMFDVDGEGAYMQIKNEYKGCRFVNWESNL